MAASASPAIASSTIQPPPTIIATDYESAAAAATATAVNNKSSSSSRHRGDCDVDNALTAILQDCLSNDRNSAHARNVYEKISKIISKGGTVEEVSKCFSDIASSVCNAFNGFLFILTNNGQINFVSDNVHKYLQVPPALMLHSSIFDYISQPDKSLFTKLLKSSFGEPEIESFSCRFIPQHSAAQFVAQDYEVSAIRVSESSKSFEDEWLCFEATPQSLQSCVICVARRCCDQESSFDGHRPHLLLTLNTSRIIVSAQCRDLEFDLEPSEISNRGIKELCVKDDSSLLDSLLDSTMDCCPELRLCIKNHIIICEARILKLPDGDVVLGCTIIRSKTISNATTSGIEKDVEKTAEQSSANFSNSEETTANAADSTTTKYETLSPPSSVAAETEGESGSDALSQLCTTIFSESESTADYATQCPNTGAPPTASPHVGQQTFQYCDNQVYFVACSGDLPKPTSYPSQYQPAEAAPTVETTKNGKSRKPRRPRQPKAAGLRQRGGHRKKAATSETSNNSYVAYGQTWDAQYPAGMCVSGAPVRDALLKSLLQPSYTVEASMRCSNVSPMSGTIICSDIVPMKAAADPQASYVYHDCTSTREDSLQNDSCDVTSSSSVSQQQAMYPSTITPMAPMQPFMSEGFIPSEIAQSTPTSSLNNTYDAQISPSSSTKRCYPDNIAGPSNPCSAFESSSQIPESSMMPMNSVNPEMMGGAMQMPRYHVGQHMMQNGPVWTANSQAYGYQQQMAMYQQQQQQQQQQHIPLPQIRMSSLKRKSSGDQCSQPEPPCKYSPVNNAHYQSFQQLSPSQYQQNQQCTSSSFVQGVASNNTLTPYTTYESNPNGAVVMNGVNQWPRRSPSNSERIRMGLRQSVQARQQASSPNPSAVLSPNEYGNPRFMNSTNYVQSVSPQMLPTGSSPVVQPTFCNDVKSSDSNPSVQQAPYCVLNEPIFGADGAQSFNNSQFSMPIELYDFNLGNGGFDMDSDATRSLVQKLLS